VESMGLKKRTLGALRLALVVQTVDEMTGGTGQ